MSKVNMLIVGVGGQGSLLTSRIVGNLALEEGYDVKLSEVHGMAQRGGSVVTHIRYGEKVNAPIVEVGDADIIVSFEKLEALRYVHYLKEDGVLIVNSQEIDPMSVIVGLDKYPDNIIDQLEEGVKNLIVMNALDEARGIGNIKVVNTILLGALSKYLEFDKEKWIEAIKKTVPEKTVDINLKAFNRGLEISLSDVEELIS
ncbi:indolepyruvate ferredoxin oxidoreductase beta subunit [Natranaerovirga pectinivora]|uniref:Indolepyruvate ferredoxin oxidoreductase beta subunit n=1 Tax=Natranaerovirga pectinivora TaxID=682400 RepID=A0A4R3MSZ4_9FIRM|nr:indolepyruvate oxidoreductase subunit beta [Natranaerovirga pectinivora]TCT16830.1 indolepyruvate ferredoxin oxidoreductase beta subunit [Natranaerovirga pectinivora]